MMHFSQILIYLSLMVAFCPSVGLGDETAHHHEPSVTTEDGAPCSSCEVRQQMKNMRLLAIKSQILSKLRLKQAPNISKDVVNQLLPKAPPVQELLDQYDVLGDDNQDRIMEEDDEHFITQTIMTMATEPESIVQIDRKPKCCFFSPKIQVSRIVSAHLWFHIRPAEEDTTVVLMISRLRPATNQTRRVGIRSLKIDVNAGISSWQSMDVRQVLTGWLKQPGTNWGIEINAFDSKGNDLVITSAEAGEEGLEPFMKVKISESPKRYRRDSGLDCDENSSESRCCRYPLTVDFEAFGWDWVIAPKRYKANYCAGECEYMQLQKTPYSHLVNKANPRGTVGPCCTSTKMSPINMLYFNRKEQIIYGQIPNMVVDRCGCS